MEWNGERETMSEAVEKYAKEYALKQHVKIVKNLMETTGFTQEKALDALGIWKSREKKENWLLNSYSSNQWF